MRRTLLAVLLLIPLRLLAQPDTSDTRLLQTPAVSRDHIVFVYADDLWICDLDGRNVRRLTSDPGIELNPAFSPDSRTIAFSGQYDAASPGFGVEAASIYTVPITGGEPTRLTWYGWDFVRGWTPDGKAVLLSSWREVVIGSDTPLLTVPAAGGYPSAAGPARPRGELLPRRLPNHFLCAAMHNTCYAQLCISSGWRRRRRSRPGPGDAVWPGRGSR